jgi:hypothetical protein
MRNKLTGSRPSLTITARLKSAAAAMVARIFLSWPERGFGSVLDAAARRIAAAGSSASMAGTE